MQWLAFESNGVTIWRHDLSPGIHTVGRNPNNSVVLHDETVSGLHCELEVSEDGRMRVRDLGSTNGTWVNGERVTEHVLTSRDVLMVGSVQLRLGADHAEPGQSSAAPMYTTVTKESVKSFWAGIPGALRFPFREEILVPMVLVLILEHFHLLLPRVLQVAGLLIGLLVAWYLFTTIRAVVWATIEGRDKLPPSVQVAMDFGEAKETFLKYLLLALTCLGLPQTANWIPGVPGWVKTALPLAGTFYVSMAFLALVVTDSLAGLNPLFTFVSIMRAPIAYVVVSVPAMIVFGLGSMVKLPGNTQSQSQWASLVVGTLLTAFNLYLLFVWARLLGIFYRSYREPLAWDEGVESPGPIPL
jgi:hypothetical protein